MKMICKLLLCFFLTLCFSIVYGTYTINVFSAPNGVGQQNGRLILKNSLEELGHTAFEKNRHSKPSKDEPVVDINIYTEFISTAWLPLARYNWFMPNPEYYLQNLDLLQKVDLILCRTQEAERIFQDLNLKTYYLGFTSRDCFLENTIKDYEACFHLAGRSIYKGTATVVKAWHHHLTLPELTVVIQEAQRPFSPLNQKNVNWLSTNLPFDELQELQNSCGIHLCPSEVEGYGHYIVEGMSTQAIVITTDAPPMNEFITDKRCLLSYKKSSPINLGTKYSVDPKELRAKVKGILKLSHEEKTKIGKKNRQVYLQRQQEFKENLKNLLLSISE